MKCWRLYVEVEDVLIRQRDGFQNVGLGFRVFFLRSLSLLMSLHILALLYRVLYILVNFLKVSIVEAVSLSILGAPED